MLPSVDEVVLLEQHLKCVCVFFIFSLKVFEICV